MLFMIEDLGAEPIEKRFFIGATKLPYLGQLTDLRSVCFNGSPFPHILGKESHINTNLGSKKSYHIWGYLRL